MRIIIFILMMLLTVNCYSESKPKMLVDKNTNQVISWGYTNFTPNDNQEVIEGVYLEGSQNCDNGLTYENGKVKNSPEFKKKIPTEKERILKELGISEKDLDNIKKL